MNINYEQELQKMKDSINFIFADLTNPLSNYRDQGECNLNGLVDTILVLAQIHRNDPPTPMSPHAEQLLERLGIKLQDWPYPW